ncbi:MAG: hypothetical protein DME22_14990 [Verrucomicrobia bacterium]|nr:MAG: hypothetical protein DME22_14990 [Verrucomicrobiota bacterium]PYJ97995.1 MAG: hypothetical protein DME23_13345 [Verrucomicrobiota bacterium]
MKQSDTWTDADREPIEEILERASTNWCRANCFGTNDRSAPGDTPGQIVFLQRCGFNEPSPFLELSRNALSDCPNRAKENSPGSLAQRKSCPGSTSHEIILPLLHERGLEQFGKLRNEFGEAEGPQGRASGRERVTLGRVRNRIAPNHA